MIKNLANKEGIKPEALRFVLVGIGSVSVDALVYSTFVSLNLVDAQSAKKLSFISGSIFGFFVNRSFTFKIKSKKIRQPILYSILYFVTFMINYLVHDLTLAISGNAAVGFLSATICSTVINFLGQRYYVFKQ